MKSTPALLVAPPSIAHPVIANGCATVEPFAGRSIDMAGRLAPGAGAGAGAGAAEPPPTIGHGAYP